MGMSSTVSRPNAAVSAMLDRLLHHAHVLKCGPRSYRTTRGDMSPSAAHE